MRVALVSPYSWTYPGGVTRHIEALAGELDRVGHDVKVLAPFDPDRRRPRCCTAARGRRCATCRNGWCRSGRTIGWPLNGAVSESSPASRRRSRRCAASCARAAFDVVHLHEPVAPAGRLGHADERGRAARGHVPLLLGVGACRTRSRRCSARGASSTACNVRIAVSEAAAWTGRRFYGGRYRVIPNGVVVPDGGVPRAARAPARRAAADRVRRPGRRAQGPAACCCAPSRRCAAQIPAELTVIG